MGLRSQAIIVTLVFTGAIACANAQTRHDSIHVASTDTPRLKLTGKERLGRKWSDEQRIDNCHVPIDKRGTKQRPTACPNDPSS